MGALHAGHASLIERAAAVDDFVVVSVFVNPTQFGPAEDFDAYPRRLQEDASIAAEHGAHLVFAPTVEEMYPPGASTFVEVEGLTANLCGAVRPGHFRGVTTVVGKLFNIVAPDRAYFGEKDYQQMLVISKMVRDMHMPVEVVACPTVRETDGLAMSSRNAYLTAEQRAAAPAIRRGLLAGERVVKQGGSASEAVQTAIAQIATEPILKVQYVEAVDPETLTRPDHNGAPMLLAAAVFAGDTRLIDNIVVEG
jgi:pantoate--beta-alanine ligase